MDFAESRKRKDWRHQKTKKAVEHKDDSDTNCTWCTWNSSKGFGKGTEGTRNLCKDSHYSIVEIGKNTEKSTEDLRRLAVTQTPMKTIS